MGANLTEQMEEFAASLQKAMAAHMQQTLNLQVDMLRAVHDPVEQRMQSIATSVQNIFAEQMNLISTGMANPMSQQVEDFSASVRRIMSEQLQIFAESTARPTPEQLEEFFEGMRGTMAEQMQLAADLQTIMAKQMQEFLDNLRVKMADLAGGAQEGADE